MAFDPTWAPTGDGSVGAAIFLGLFTFLTGVRVKEGWVAIGIVGLSGHIYEVSEEGEGRDAREEDTEVWWWIGMYC